MGGGSGEPVGLGTPWGHPWHHGDPLGDPTPALGTPTEDPFGDAQGTRDPHIPPPSTGDPHIPPPNVTLGTPLSPVLEGGSEVTAGVRGHRLELWGGEGLELGVTGGPPRLFPWQHAPPITSFLGHVRRRSNGALLTLR